MGYQNSTELGLVYASIPGTLHPRGGGGLPRKSDGDARRRKIQIKHLRETNVGVAQA